MKIKLRISLAIDFVLTVLFVLMFHKQAISLKFHEIAGFIVLVGGLVHLLLHPQYIVSMTKKIFCKNTDGVCISGSIRFGYVINLLLLIVVVVMLINSIMVSNVIFHSEPNPLLIDIHKTLGALMLLLVSIHLGLHFTMIATKIKFPKVVSIVVMSIILLFGVYSLVTSLCKNYLGAVFITAENEVAIGQGGENRPGNGLGLGLGKAPGIGFNRGMNNGEPPAPGQGEPPTLREGEPPVFMDGDQRDNMPHRPIVWKDALYILITYGSILYLFAFLTHLVDESFKKKKKTYIK